MIKWLGQAGSRLGQEEQESPEDAAARAAFDEAQNADWPPKRDDVKSVGAAAGGAAAGAACIAAGSVTAGVSAALSFVCADIGAVIGDYLGGAIYDIVDGFFGGEEYVEPQFDHVIYRRTRDAAIRLAKLRLGMSTGAPSNADVLVELEALKSWGVPAATLAAGGGPTGAQRGQWQPYFNREGLDTYLHLLASGESARASEIVTQQKLGQWRALAQISDFCSQDQACIGRTINDLDTLCRERGFLPDTPEYANCGIFLASQLRKPVKPSSSAPVIVAGAVALGLAWLLFAA